MTTGSLICQCGNYIQQDHNAKLHLVDFNFHYACISCGFYFESKTEIKD